MGYITNAVGLRLNLNQRGWSSKLVTSSNFNIFLYQLKNYLSDLLFSSRFQNKGFIYSHAAVKLYLDRIEIVLFVYDGRLEEQISYLRTLMDRPFWKLKRPYAIRHKKLKGLYHYRTHSRIKRKLDYTFSRTIKFLDFAVSIYNFRKISSVIKFRRLIFGKLRIYFLSRKAAAITYSLKKYFNFSIACVKFSPIGTDPVLNPLVVARYIIRKLYHKYRLMEIINPLVKGISNYFTGVRIDCAGRFTRAQRASFSSLQLGRVPLNSFRYPIEYAHATIPLKYGMCSIKVWLCYNTKRMAAYSSDRRFRSLL